MKNTKNPGYSINWQTNTITMTKKFAAEANIYGSEAYNMLLDVKSKGFRIAVQPTQPRQACPTRVTYKQMEITLSCMSDPDERLAELHAIMDAAKGQYIRFLPEVLRLLRAGGILITDNILQEGDVLSSRFAVTRRNRTIHSRMREYVRALAEEPSLETLLLPTGDGAAVCLKQSGT